MGLGSARLVLVIVAFAACARGTGDDTSGVDGGDASADSHAGDAVSSPDSNNADVQSGGCNATSCDLGCCSGTTCAAGTADDACGTNGDLCADCTGSGQVCSGQTCAPKPCNKTTCPKGCCSLGACVAGQSDQACGTGGILSIDCSKQSLVCLNGYCTQ